jgi:hypothetical protein
LTRGRFCCCLCTRHSRIRVGGEASSSSVEMATEVSKRGLAGPRDRRKTGKGNPFDSDEEETTTSRARNARKEPVRRGGPTSSSLAAAAASQTEELFSYGDSRPKSRYQSGNNNGGAYDETYESHQGEADGEEYVNQAVLDLEKHALKKSQETTSTIKNCVRVAEDTMGIGVQTLITLHDQGIQIERTHEKAVQIDQHLSRVKYTFFLLTILFLPKSFLLCCCRPQEMFSTYVGQILIRDLASILRSCCRMCTQVQRKIGFFN